MISGTTNSISELKIESLRVPLGTFITEISNGSHVNDSYHIINRRYDPNIIMPHSVNPSDIASSLTYQELADKLLTKYDMRSSINRNGDIEFR